MGDEGAREVAGKRREETGGTVSRTLTKEYRTCGYLSSDKLRAVN